MTKTNPDEINSGVRLHINKFWHGNNMREFHWRSGPIPKYYNNFSVCQIEPQEIQDEWVYITIGASEVHSPDHEHLEFFILAPEQDLIHIDTLAMVANYHADPSYGVYLGRVINIGRPWVENSTCEYFLVSRPYTLGRKLEELRSEKLIVSFLWLLPVTASEVDYLNKYGQEALEEKFENVGIEYLNPNRKSVV